MSSGIEQKSGSSPDGHRRASTDGPAALAHDAVVNGVPISRTPDHPQSGNPRLIFLRATSSARLGSLPSREDSGSSPFACYGGVQSVPRAEPGQEGTAQVS